MREIKFRFYDNKENKMLIPKYLIRGLSEWNENKNSDDEKDDGIFRVGSLNASYDPYNDDDYLDGGLYTAKERFILMQYTGLKDKNGKEIYEGDILKVDWKDNRYKSVIGMVEWDNENAAYRFAAGSPSEVSWSHEIIGNIYENPELLKLNS